MADILGFDDLLAEYDRLAAKADARLRRLEQAGKTGGSAYKSAAQSVPKKPQAGGKPRFRSGGRPKTKREARARINAVNRFLNEESSTLKGQAAIASRIGETIKSKYGLNLTGEQIKSTFDGALWSKLNQRYGSGTAVKILASIQKSKGSAKKTLEDLAEKNVFLSTNEKKSLAATIGAYARKQGIEKLYED